MEGVLEATGDPVHCHDTGSEQAIELRLSRVGARLPEVQQPE